ncbi:hypothetical protein [Fibrivirga algicola]|uniref:Uncharacterized protein n=1 Tax=Fibrivirga algicola TaxID=2950420 RepID=A0ABX0QED2_9BACT|nr:hypothetical protein [Fibrivirga algicola]ARK12879.1 hypothetical protein A6C57_22505 [Fibrella sp. ES10-3-2-2]NID09570.1 hypothetical protein [Fibrivirga algicola]
MTKNQAIATPFLTRMLRHAAGLLAIGLVACSSPQTAPTPGSGNYVKVTLNGQTKTYTNVKLDEEGVAGGLRLWSLEATASEDDFLSVSMWGSGTGAYPYKPTVTSFNQVSQIEYRTKNGMLASYAALVCPDQAGFYAPQGSVTVTQYSNGKAAKGTFSGALMSDQDADNCNKQGTPFSGEFSISQ